MIISSTKKARNRGFFVRFCFYLINCVMAVGPEPGIVNSYLALRRCPFYPFELRRGGQPGIRRWAWKVPPFALMNGMTPGRPFPRRISMTTPPLSTASGVAATGTSPARVSGRGSACSSACSSTSSIHFHRDDLQGVLTAVQPGILDVFLGNQRVVMPSATAASSFSLRPPMSNTSPRRVISPVMATSQRTGMVRLTPPLQMAMPADDRPFGIAPGRWMWDADFW